jgi:antitoxin YefM
MRVVGYSEFRNHLVQNLNAVNEDKEIVVVSRTHGKNVVVIDMDEYNSIVETLYLVNNKANRIRLEEAVEEMNKGISFKHNLIEE